MPHKIAAASVELLASPPLLEECGIVISTGRCGSTLLSTLIAEEPQTLSVPESLGPLLGHLARESLTGQITGAQYWSLLSRPTAQREEMARIGDMLSTFSKPGAGRFVADKRNIPPIMLVTLPAISAEPELLFTVLAEKVPRFPLQSAGLHHKMLLDLLATLAGLRRWLERSGASSPVAGPLLRAMPEARVVYLTRDVVDTARSMSKHVAFRFALARYELYQRYGADPYHAGRLPEPAELPEELRNVLPDQITARAMGDLGRDLGRYEAMCAHMMELAEQAFADLKPPHLHRIRYEDLVASPDAELTRLGEFLGFANPALWAAATAGRVRRT